MTGASPVDWVLLVRGRESSTSITPTPGRGSSLSALIRLVSKPVRLPMSSGTLLDSFTNINVPTATNSSVS
ncbi:hypothetical protein FOQG_17563 [Fusarium oxysporum f. sp. raphani 54005]|uniref:Uncharacterized protein n=1 Tax=Fusarium oxysporum f. sp. raphani 54005 TaxID=1089458 RepID=X0BFY6_FUSOX|nr:hypothetical protein FOQG_17563 [Fusarium oxysporum f. sp. raphani 54005]